MGIQDQYLPKSIKYFLNLEANKSRQFLIFNEGDPTPQHTDSHPCTSPLLGDTRELAGHEWSLRNTLGIHVGIHTCPSILEDPWISMDVLRQIEEKGKLFGRSVCLLMRSSVVYLHVHILLSGALLGWKCEAACSVFSSLT